MFWRGFLDSAPRITFTIAAPTGRKKILHQTPLSTFSECLNFVFQGVACPELVEGGGAQATSSYGQERERTERDGKESGANGQERASTGIYGNLRERSRLAVS